MRGGQQSMLHIPMLLPETTSPMAAAEGSVQVPGPFLNVAQLPYTPSLLFRVLSTFIDL